MISYLIAISFLLHGILLVAIVILSLRVSKAKELEKRQEQIAKEIEDTFTAYLIEIKEENANLLNKLEENGDNGGKVKPDEETLEDAPYILNTRNDINHSYDQVVEQEDTGSKRGNKNETPSYQPPVPDEQDHYQPSIESTVLQMYNEGATIEEIAKRLDRGTTEIELTLKFHSRMS
ncbi:coupling factor for flagellin transcription and translation [Pontibacillus salipaludis]|uniref:Swarming motility protein SwrB n=1 Tax=Pontibacillus salipaludis TaxID=1697394 RepID=A0ABQ1PHB5_9BACI|nr:coupling factor for flagellin transcription and translation [Pontibacillus salipaludis]GGC97147.1 swarming motility protein SwrB [Pontibacillus salipaludis]